MTGYLGVVGCSNEGVGMESGGGKEENIANLGLNLKSSLLHDLDQMKFQFLLYYINMRNDKFLE